MTTVSELMTKKVGYVQKNESLAAAAKKMWDCDCGAIPVVDESGVRVVGMITDRDICMAAWSRNSAPGDIEVSSAMSPNLFYCSPSDDATTAEALMRSRQIRRVPVLDSNRRLVGILSLADVARRARRTPDIRPEEVATVLADICQPPGNAPYLSA